jgi:hypothetical protein
MKKKLIFFGAVIIVLLLTSGTFAYTYTNSNTTLPVLANGNYATYEVSPNQPDWNSILPGNASEILVPIGCGDETQLPMQYPSSGSHWDKVDDQPNPDEANTYVSTAGSNSWKRDFYELSDSTIASGGEVINSITVYYRFASSSTSTVSAKPLVKTEGTVFNGMTTTSSSTSFTTVSWDLANNPATSEPWTWDEINNLQAGVEMKGSSSTKAAICTQVYVKVNYKYCAIEGEVPTGDLYIITPDVHYTGDLLVKIYITNVADLSKAYQYLNMKIYIANSLEAGKSPQYQVLSLENGVVVYNIIGGSSSSYLVQLIGGSYNLVSSNPDDWGAGATVVPEFYCEVSQR